MKGKATPTSAVASAQQAAIMERRKDVSNRVSETTRFIGFGLLATFYAIISGTDPFFEGLRANWTISLRLIALAGAAAVLFDYLHYVFAYFSANRALTRADVPNAYNTGWLTYRLEHVCFWTKQAAALLGCILVLIMIGGSLG